MTRRKRKHRGGFSLLELVIVIVIVAIIAAIAIPRMSRGSAGAADSALTGDLAVLRNAIDLYAAEHGGTFPDVDDIADQLLQYTDSSGDAQSSKDTTHIYGPYLRKIPPLPVGAKKGKTGIDDETGDDIGWIYTESTGEIKANTTDDEKDATDTPYNTY